MSKFKRASKTMNLSKQTIRTAVLLVLISGAGAQPPAQPQAQAPTGAAAPSGQSVVGDPISVWLMSQVTAAESAQAKSTPTSAISLDRGSTSLVDQSSGPDLLNTALSLTPVTSSSGSSGNNGTGTVTASLYSLYALAIRQDPLTPLLYDKDSSVRLRQLFFTVGHESENTTTSSGPGSSGGSSAASSAASNSSSSTSTSTAQAGVVYGARYLFVNRRDATSIFHDPCVRNQISAALTSIGAPIGRAGLAVLKAQATLGITATSTPDDVGAAVNKLPKDSQEYKDIQQALATLKAETKEQVGFDDSLPCAGSPETLNQILKELQGRMQFALDFQTIQRTGTSPSDYRGELIFDQGYHRDDFHLTLNGSYDYSNSPKIGGDLRVERGAAGLSYNVTKVGATSLHSPLQLQLSGEGTRTEHTWGYRAQFQVTVPITAGVSLPASFGYANEITELRQLEKGVYGKFGLSFDFSKLASLLRSQK